MLTHLVTDIGDSAVIAGITLAGMIYLLQSRCYRSATALAASFVGTGLLIGCAKLLFLGCNGHLADYDIHSPSGHTALSVAVFGTCTLLVSQKQARWRCYALGIVFLLFVTAIAMTRVMLGCHTVAEVVLGGLIGAVTLLSVYVFLKRSRDVPEYDRTVFAVLMISIMAALYSVHFPAENYIRLIAHYMKMHMPVCATS